MRSRLRHYRLDDLRGLAEREGELLTGIWVFMQAGSSNNIINILSQRTATTVTMKMILEVFRRRLRFIQSAPRTAAGPVPSPDREG
jgi:hypothetical protein